MVSRVWQISRCFRVFHFYGRQRCRKEFCFSAEKKNQEAWYGDKEYMGSLRHSSQIQISTPPPPSEKNLSSQKLKWFHICSSPFLPYLWILSQSSISIFGQFAFVHEQIFRKVRPRQRRNPKPNLIFFFLREFFFLLRISNLSFLSWSVCFAI